MHCATFQHCADTVVTFINATKHTLLIGVCWFTHPAIYSALKHANARKVQIKLVLNYDQINFHPKGLDFEDLEKFGALVFGYTGPGLLHHKFAVSDNCRVLTGSFNWTQTNQCDHLVILNDAALAAQFKVAVDNISAKCLRLIELRQVQPRQISFAHLYRPALWSVHDLRKGVISGANVWIVLAKTEQDWQQWIGNQRHILPYKSKGPLRMDQDVWDEQSFRNGLLSSAFSQAVRNILIRYCLRLQMGDILVSVSVTGNLLGVGIVGAGPELNSEMPNVVSRFVQWLVVNDSAAEINTVRTPMPTTPIARHKGSALALISILEKLL
jgi:hypothetical protein